MEQELTGRGVHYCAACDGMFYRGKTVVLVGGGNSAVADALVLSMSVDRRLDLTAVAQPAKVIFRLLAVTETRA